MKASAFSKAMLYHIRWKVQLRKFLNGKGSMTKEECISPDHCRFGQWLRSDEVRTYASAPEIEKIRRVHNEVHIAAERVYEFKSAGNDSAALREFGKVERASMKLVSLLNTMNIINRN
jgi:hypothetical protein